MPTNDNHDDEQQPQLPAAMRPRSARPPMRPSWQHKSPRPPPSWPGPARTATLVITRGDALPSAPASSCSPARQPLL